MISGVNPPLTPTVDGKKEEEEENLLRGKAVGASCSRAGYSFFLYTITIGTTNVPSQRHYEIFLYLPTLPTLPHFPTPLLPRSLTTDN
ncbi:MAG: hypothetical protein SWX82_20420 [Cyanobacteriota bacterium]|nr:hypothetical protein [Cyanobacteriota bacterium]